MSVQGGVEGELEGLGVDLGGVNFSGETVSISVGGATFTASRADLSADGSFVTDFSDATGNIEAAQKVAEILGAGMDAIASFDSFFIINSNLLPPRETFTAKFEDAAGTPDITVLDVNREIFSDVIGGYPTVDRFEFFGENFVAVVYDEGQPIERAEVYYRDNSWSLPTSAFEAAIADSFDLFFTLATFGFTNLEGPQTSDGLIYLLESADGVQSAFSNSFNFEANDDGVVVEGSTSADLIDAFYAGQGGDFVGEGDDVVRADSGDDTVRAGLGNDTLSGGAGNDLLDGGEGHDTVLLDGQSDDFIFEFDANLTVRDTNTSSGLDEGTDTLINIEQIDFSDGSHTEIGTNSQGLVLGFFDDAEAPVSVRTVFDTADAFNWAGYTQTFADDGATLTDRETVFDDGRVLNVDYVDGIRSSQVMTDVAAVYSWSSYMQDFDVNGVLISTTYFDDIA